MSTSAKAKIFLIVISSAHYNSSIISPTRAPAVVSKEELIEVE